MENSKSGFFSLPGDIWRAHRKPADSTGLLEGTSIRRLTLLQLLWLFLLVIPGAAAGSVILLIKGTFGLTVPGGPAASPGEMLFADALLFLIAWIAYLFMVALVRTWGLRFLGDSGTYRQVYHVAWIAAWPMVAIAAFLKLVAVLVPGTAPSAVGYTQFALSMLLFLAGMILEARYTVKVHRAIFGQNTGRAFITWISPFALWFLFAWLFVQILGLFA